MRPADAVRAVRRALVGSREADRRAKARNTLRLALHETLCAARGKVEPAPQSTVAESTLESWTMALAQARGLASVKRAQERAQADLARRVG